MIWTDDPLDDFHRHDAEQEEALSRCPICVCCGEPIQDEYCYELDDGDYCEQCLEEKIDKWKDEHWKSIDY